MKPLAACAAGVGLFAIALHVRTLHDPFVGDDATYISENPAVTAGAPLGRIFFDPSVTSGDSKPIYRSQVWRPLRVLAYRALVAAFGARPEPIRGANLLLYGLAAALVVLMTHRLTRHLAAAAIAGALWAAWPVHVEPVVYASALGDGISLACVLGAVLLAPRSLALSLALGAAALLSKEMAITTPALVVLWLWAIGGSRRRMIVLGAAHAGIAVAYLIVRTHVVGQLGQGATTGAAIGSGVFGAARLAWVYVRLTLVPLGHSMAYALPAAGAMARLFAWLIVAGICALAWRSGNRAVQFGLAWFVISLLPVLQLVPVAADLGDRFVHQPSLGLAIALAGAALLLPERARRLLAIAGAAAIVLYAGGSVAEQAAWSSELALWRHAAEEQPASAQAHANYGTALLQREQFAAALAELDRARELGWGGDELELRRGMALLALGRTDEAAAAAETAVRQHPGLGRAWALLGHLALSRGDLATAAADLERAQKTEPGEVSVALFAAELLQKRGQLADAAHEYAALAARFPSSARFEYLAARSALDASDRAAASAHARACLALEPGQPQCQGVLAAASATK